MLKLKCYVDKDASSSKRELSEFKQRVPFHLDIEEIDMRDLAWRKSGNRYYLADSTFNSLTQVQGYHGVMIFIDEDNWKNGEQGLKGFQFNKTFNGMYTMVTKFRFRYDDTAVHELNHFYKDFILLHTGINLSTVFGVNDYDDDIVHSKENEGYDFSDEYLIIEPYLKQAVEAHDNGTKDTMQSIRDILKRSLGTYGTRPISSPEDTQEPETVNRGDNFNKAVEVILEHEGGYVNDPRDPGGETNYGISKRSYPNEDIANLTVERAKEIYYNDYWLKCRCDKLPYNVALNVFDTAVNVGVTKSIKIMQYALGVIDDGIIGPITLGAMQNASQETVLRFAWERTLYYQSLPKFDIYGKGWTNRLYKTLIKSIK